ncbi:MAG TPA: thiamine phosphate synthase [Candidatus Corynebacterium avicola]|uniref:Thiamine-phosphate synthase n=1 Tax=Candidatus Corynebacterium avicola TaxID=2838527 RepID=A0A9D1ULB7_9CORY|nr:thiamine phosphate synthase [Candidatus Corynebacterium avicola]
MSRQSPPTTDWSLYLVTDPELGGGRDAVVPLVTAAVSGGVSVVQLRDKHLDSASFTERARDLAEALRPTGVPLFLNDRVEIAADLGLHLHIGQDDMDYAEARNLLPETSMIGLSVDRHEQIDTLQQLIDRGIRPPDVLGLGPVELTDTKTDTGRALGVTGPGSVSDLATHALTLGIPCVAIGHVGSDNAAALARTPVAGLCVVSAIMAAGSTAAASSSARQLRSLFTTSKENS